MEQATYIVLGAVLALAGSIITARIELRRSLRLRVLHEVLPRLDTRSRQSALDELRRTCLLLSPAERSFVNKLHAFEAEDERALEERDETLERKQYDAKYKAILDRWETRSNEIAAESRKAALNLESEIPARLKHWWRW